MGGPRGAWESDSARRDLTTFYMFLAIQEIIDLAAHWAADSGWGVADDSAAMFDTLAQHGVSDQRTVDVVKGAVGLRNRIAHGYASLDPERLYDEIREGLPELLRFLKQAADAAGV